MTKAEVQGFTFMVGVTGHRDLIANDDTALAERIDALLTELRVALGPVPLSIACGMADGADRIVAYRALDLGIAVHAVLPMPKHHYLSDFSSASAKELEALLARDGVSLHEIPLHADTTPAAIAERGPARDRQYGLLGDYLQRRSNLMLGLWDGSIERLEGGTADVLLSYLYGQGRSSEDAEISSFTFVEDAPIPPVANLVIWIEVDRQSGADPRSHRLSYLGAMPDARMVVRTEEMPSTLKQRLASLRAHFEEYDRLKENGQAPPAWGLLDGLPKKPPASLQPILARIDAEYQRADGLAVHNQNRSDRIFKIFGFMAGAMGLFFLLYAKIAALKVFLIVYLLLFASGYVIFRLAKKNRWFSRYLVYRVIAESMRVHFYMVLAGVHDRINVHRLVSLTGIESFSGFSWMFDVMRMVQPFSTDSWVPNLKALDLVKEGWIDDQSTYFQSKIHNLSHSHHRLERIKNGLLALSLIGVVVLLLFKYHLTSVIFTKNLDLKTVMVFLMGLLPLWLGIWEAYQSKMAMRELLWQYRNQAEHFRWAAEQAKGDISTEELQRVIADLGERSLFETYLWTIHRYHREVEPPSAG
jgi:hypothetical protein